MVDRDELLERATHYGRENGVDILDESLGWGQDGFVWKTADNTAVKVFDRVESYDAELECYRRLKAANITMLGVLAVPELIHFSDFWRIIEMTIVEPPFILDFGKAVIDRPSPFDPTMMAESDASRQEMWGEHFPDVQVAVAMLRRLGILYLDTRPGNIMFRDWDPDL